MATLPGREIARQFLVVERPDPVCWMQPDAELKIADFTADGKTDVSKFFACDKRRHPGGMNYSTVGGATRFISETTTDAELEALLRGLPVPEPTIDETAPSDAPSSAEESTLESPPESETDAESDAEPV